MLILADSGMWVGFVVIAMFFLLWGFTAYDIVKSRAGWGYTLGIVLAPCIAALLWWAAGKWDKGDPQRAAIAQSHKRRLWGK